MGLFILIFSIATIIYLRTFYKLINDNTSNKSKIIIGIIIFIMFIICTIELTRIITYDTYSITNIINNYKSNKIKEIIIENQDTREKLKIEFINKIDDSVVNQYYINCVTENGIIGYPIHYCPICGEKLK